MHSVIKSDVLLGHALTDGEIGHAPRLVVGVQTIVATHQQFVHFSLLVEHHCRQNAIGEHGTQTAIWIHPRTQNQRHRMMPALLGAMNRTLRCAANIPKHKKLLQLR